MRIASILTIVLALSGVAWGDAPHHDTLVAMGLGEMQILTDGEASTIRGRGFKLADKLAGLENFKLNKQAFKIRTAEFHGKLAGRTFIGAANFGKSKAAFHAHVKSFKGKIH